MRCVFCRAIPFVLTLTIGIAVDSLLSATIFRPTRQQSVALKAWVYEEPVIINSIPDVDFPKSIQQVGGLWTKVRLRALFDRDGQVKQITAENYALDDPTGELNQMPPKPDDDFTAVICRDATQTAIDQLSKTWFRPRIVNGEAVSEWVTVDTIFAYNFRQQPGYCAITVKISGEHTT